MASRSGRKYKKKRKPGTEASSNPDANETPGDSTFFNGLMQGAASSPTDSLFCYDSLIERKNMSVALIQSECDTAKRALTVLEDTTEEINKYKCNVAFDSVCEEDDSLYDVVAKVLLDAAAASNRSAASRKIESSSSCNSMQPPSSNRRRSRSVGPPGNPLFNKTRRLSGSCDNFSCFKTPMGTKNFAFNIATVTPNPNMLNSTAGIFRKPRPGEQAISMSGSPLLVASDFVSSPSVTVPLADGRVFNVMGDTGPMRDHLRHGLDRRTKERLRVLKNVLCDLVPE